MKNIFDGILKRWNRHQTNNLIKKNGVILHLDSPTSAARLSQPFLIVSGYVVSGKSSNIGIHDIRIEVFNTVFHPHEIERKDVAVAFEGLHTIGFQKLIALDKSMLGSYTLRVRVEHQKKISESVLTFKMDESNLNQFYSKKEQKLKTLAPLMIEKYPKNQWNYNTLWEQSFEETGNISAHDYDEKAQEIISDPKNKLILDAGSGLRGSYYENVINLEIAAYPTTDVIGTVDRLPFKDNSFDAVLSLNVLEHVGNPHDSAKEMIRVLKPGGTLYVAVPFLQPFHGYPNHYYNMTISGLKNLFEKDCEIMDGGVLEAGHPIYAIEWILKSYIHGLPAAQRFEFEKLTVSQLIKLSKDTPLIKTLSEKTVMELSCVNYLLAKKQAGEQVHQ